MNFSAIKREEIPGEIPEIQMSEAERAQISSFIESEFGIKMPAIKKVLLTGRLAKRLRALGFSSYGDYYRFIRSDKGAAELFIFADLISTHETSFFREEQHFAYLYSEILPRLAESTGAGVKRAIRILSAACSTGEEVYSIAMTIEEFKRKVISNYMYNITGSDISIKVIESAKRAVYSNSRLKNVSGEYQIELTTQDPVLVFSFVGYKSTEIKVNGKSLLDVTLEEEVHGLDEVVVVGYGTVKKSDLTGSVSTVKVEALNNTPANSIDRLL